MTRQRAVFLAAAVLAATTVLRAQENVRITPLVNGNQVVVSFELSDVYTDALRDAIASGLRTMFTYQLELRTVSAVWFDRTISTTVVTASDQFDNLTRRHRLTRTVDGRVIDVTVTDDEEVVKTWLTKWSRVPVTDTSKLDPTRDYYIRVTTKVRPFGGSLLGDIKTITGQAKFTFIP